MQKAVGEGDGRRVRRDLIATSPRQWIATGPGDVWKEGLHPDVIISGSTGLSENKASAQVLASIFRGGEEALIVLIAPDAAVLL
jgi:hypothetical protein